MLIPFANQICIFCSRSPNPPNTGNSNRRQDGSRFCEETETTIRHDVSVLRAEKGKEENCGDCIAIAIKTCTLNLRVNEENRGEEGRKESPSLRYIDSHFLSLSRTLLSAYLSTNLHPKNSSDLFQCKSC